jgi:large subunit ribosomal protein L15
MPVNKRSKYRGSRTCGGGTHKNRRGAGNRGGRGRAGHRDHRFTHYLLANDVHNGKNGFISIADPVDDVIDVGDIDQAVPALVEQGFATMDGDIVTIDASLIGIDKVLGGGRVTRKMQITARAFSEQAKAKIEGSGGQALTP